MGHVPSSTWIWPGLPQLWRHGSWSGLGQAFAFALLLNGLLLATFGWTEWTGTGIRVVGWSAAGGWWIAAILRTRKELQTRTAAAGEQADLFFQAQREYLRGNWYQTELCLVQMLKHEPRDVDARLMLATLLRHVGRQAEGIEQLRRLEKTEGHEKWRLEIHREWNQLTQLKENEQSKVGEVGTISSEQGSKEQGSTANHADATDVVTEGNPVREQNINDENMNDDGVSHAA